MEWESDETGTRGGDGTADDSRDDTGPESPGGPARWWNREAPKPVGRAVLVVLALVSAFVVRKAWDYPSGVGVAVPGPVFELSGKVEGPLVVDTAPRSGRFAFTTVAVDELSVGGLLLRRIFGGEGETVELSYDRADALASMEAEKDVAAALAAVTLGDWEAVSEGARVVSVREGSPAERAGIRPGDVIEEVDGVGVAVPEDVAQATGRRPGRELTLGVRDPVSGRRLAVSLTTGEDGLMGVTLTPAVPMDRSRMFDVDTGPVGGASAGLMMWLAFVDAGSPGDLTAGMRVTGTGMVGLSGEVMPVSGVEQKAAAAVDAGYDVFFVPKGNLDAEIDGIRIVEVETVTDALSWLCSRGATDEVCDR